MSAKAWRHLAFLRLAYNHDISCHTTDSGETEVRSGQLAYKQRAGPNNGLWALLSLHHTSPRRARILD